jgi:hypothetical protein
LSEIVQKIKEKNYLILNHEKLFDQLFNLYKDKTIEELCKLKKIINLFDKKNFDINLLENYYNLIHKKGMILIQSDKLNIQEIINFVKKQDIYYINNDYKNSDHRDPSIFRSINIKEINEKNIELIKKNKILEIFESNNKKIMQFYDIFVSQVKAIKDFNYLFKIFQEWSVNRALITLINKKVNDLINQYFNEEIKDQNNEELFEIFQKIINLNIKNGLDVIQLLKSIQTNLPNNFVYDFIFF